MGKMICGFVLLIAFEAAGLAHCDSLGGPVVEAARRALASGDVNVVLPWVRPADETVIRDAFARTVGVRKLNAEATKLADTWFFETLVRVHRAGEGAAFEGLKAEGEQVDPGIEAADRAIATGKIDDLTAELARTIQMRLRESFERVMKAKKYKTADVKAGREYVAAYVEFIHLTERIDKSMGAGAHEH